MKQKPGAMAEKSRRRRKKKNLLGNHQRCWVWGRNVVLSTLEAANWPVIELQLSDRLDEQDLDFARQLADETETPVSIESPERLKSLCHTNEHQGYLARMSAFPYAEMDEILSSAEKPTSLILLDRIQDPFNFGAIVRSAVALGVDGVVIAEKQQTEVTSQVVRSSAGMINFVPIARIADLVALTENLQGEGTHVLAAVEDANIALHDYDMTQDTAVVIGSEGAGIRNDLLAVCDAFVGIPQVQDVGPLNAAVAAGIVCYEINRQRLVQKFQPPVR